MDDAVEVGPAEVRAAARGGGGGANWGGGGGGKGVAAVGVLGAGATATEQWEPMLYNHFDAKYFLAMQIRYKMEVTWF